MPGEPAPGRSTFWTSWGIPVVLVLGVAGAFALGLKQATEVSWPSAFGLGVLGVLGFGAYFLGTYQLYESAARRLGWRCEIRPPALPKSSRQGVDIVIQGVFRGRPFTLYRETPTRTGSHRVSGYYSGLEWTGPEIRLPSFSLRVTQGPDPTWGNFLTSALGRGKARPRVEFEAETKLGRRSELSAEDARAALSLFLAHRCDALDPMIRQGTIEGEPGLLVVRGKGFPFPWNLERRLAHGDEIRRVVAG